VHPIAALQTEYSLWSRDPEDEILPTCRELGIGFVPTARSAAASSPARSARPTTSPADDFRRHHPRFQGENFAAQPGPRRAVEALAQEKGCTPGSSRSPGCSRRATTSCPIPGTKRVRYLEENVGAQGAAAGTRYPEAGMRTVGR
jgi:aryl-alcohol dehydrogenase-like predicted oxidoreductase